MILPTISCINFFGFRRSGYVPGSGGAAGGSDGVFFGAGFFFRAGASGSLRGSSGGMRGTGEMGGIPGMRSGGGSDGHPSVDGSRRMLKVSPKRRETSMLSAERRPCSVASSSNIFVLFLMMIRSASRKSPTDCSAVHVFRNVLRFCTFVALFALSPHTAR